MPCPPPTPEAAAAVVPAGAAPSLSPRSYVPRWPHEDAHYPDRAPKTVHSHPLPPSPSSPSPPLGDACRRSPFFAGTKLPSRKARLHSRLPCSSRVASSARQIRSQVPSRSHWRSLRQQVAGKAYSRETSSQRQPVRSTYKIPLRTLRPPAHGRPRPQRVGGSKGRIRSHCSSVSSVSIIVPHFTRLHPFLKTVLDCQGHSTRIRGSIIADHISNTNVIR